MGCLLFYYFISIPTEMEESFYFEISQFRFASFEMELNFGDCYAFHFELVEKSILYLGFRHYANATVKIEKYSNINALLYPQTIGKIMTAVHKIMGNGKAGFSSQLFNVIRIVFL